MQPQTESITIIGAAGRMGILLAQRLSKLGYKINELDKTLPAKINKENITAAKCIILCVPIEAMPELMAQISPYLNGNQLLIDIGSIKVVPMQIMQAAYAGPIIGTHPLFGPNPQAVHIKNSANELKNELKVALTPAENCPKEWITWLSELCTQMGFSPFVSSAEQHDKAAACIQGLNFITSVAYFSMMSEHPEFIDFLTPSFQRRLESAAKSLTEDSAIFCGMFNENPSSANAVNEFRAHLAQAANDINCSLKKAQWWWQE